MDQVTFLNQLKKHVQAQLDSNKQESQPDSNICYHATILPAPWRDVKYSDLTAYIQHEKKPAFGELLFWFVDQKELDEVSVYKGARMDRRLFSRIRSAADYQPSKRTVFSLIIGLQLDEYEAATLLESAGFSFSYSLEMDLILRFFIKEKIYNMDLLNQALMEFDLEPVGCIR
ncbi:XRE family transcriptional regulator [Anoxynatronum buryatiense]|uniref:Uncharacterized protein n=1 Tax=Anoxynatronum buryatiense TaxID=489973 RepID=A0AA46AIX0_9CLOT|nr:XRE family transcriptional regulator [Anoxynatronum buryatiense]SMP54088.1 hypothetical protein SAMN06296020_10582 [Anoxynatronum buryatiense]